MKALGVKIHLKSKVSRLLFEQKETENQVTGLELENHSKIQGDKVLIATGRCFFIRLQVLQETGIGWQKKEGIQ